MRQEYGDLKRTRASLFYLVAYLFPLGAGLLISSTATFNLLGSQTEHASIAWRLFGGLLFVLALVAARLIRKRISGGMSSPLSLAWRLWLCSVIWLGRPET